MDADEETDVEGLVAELELEHDEERVIEGLTYARRQERAESEQGAE